MKKRCAYCGEMIQTSAAECPHCGRTLRRLDADIAERKTGLQKWEKGVPSWMVYGVVVLGILFVVLMYYQAAQRIAEPEKKPTEPPVQQEPKEATTNTPPASDTTKTGPNRTGKC
jgi:cytoskeletal protein RodZ